MDNSSNDPKLLLQVTTPSGIVYEKYVVSLMIRNKDGKMVINKNYSSVLEQLMDGEIVVTEKSSVVRLEVLNSWMTVSNNKCSIFSTSAKVIKR